jgi:nucleoside-diphosphate-sugar epimerase
MQRVKILIPTFILTRVCRVAKAGHPAGLSPDSSTTNHSCLLSTQISKSRNSPTMTSGRKVFLIGPGFIGGQVLDILLEEGYDVTTMVRRDAAAELMQKVGARTVLGTLEDKEIISQNVSQSDIVLHCATADHQPSVEAVLNGITKRAESGKSTIFIHTSGASLLGDNSAGDYKCDTVYQDDKPQQIDALPDSAPHRLIDLTIVKARERLGNKAKLAIMIPPLVYGVTTREKRLSIQLPTLARFALKNGFAGYVGKGLSVWSQVHVADLARGYVAIMHWLEGNTCDDIFTNPYFFCENGEEYSWGECAVEIGKALHEAGRLESPQAKMITEDLYGDVFAAYTPIVAGSNSRNRSNRLRQLGWQPRERTTLRSLHDDEIPMLLKETGEFNGYGAPVAS